MTNSDLHKATDESLMKQVQTGNEQAFAVLHFRYAPVLQRFIHKMLFNDTSHAQDILQDVFTKLFEQPEKFDTSRKFKPWIFTVTANLCKKQGRRVPTQTIDEQSNFGVKHEGDKVELEEFSIHLNDALKTMSHDHRCTFILRYQEKLPIKEIAEIMDCPAGTVKSRIHHCLKTLSHKLADHNPITQTR